MQLTTLSNPTMIASGKFVQDRTPKLRHPDKSKQKVDQLSDVDYVPTNTHSRCTFSKTLKLSSK